MAEFSLKPVMVGFIVILVGVVFAGVVADNQVANTELSTSTNEQITITGGSGLTAEDDVRGITFFGNATNNTDQGAFNVGTEVNFTKAGNITVSSLFSGGTYNISYPFEGDLYVNDSQAQTFLKLLALFFVVAVLAIGIGMIVRTSDNFNFGFK